MLQLIIKIVELGINILDLIKSTLATEKATSSLEIYTTQINISHPLPNSNNTNKSLIFIVSTTLFVSIVNIYFYDKISIILFFATLLFTILKFIQKSKFAIPKLVSRILAFKTTLYSSFAIASFFEPAFITDFQNQLPTTDKLLMNCGYLMIWFKNLGMVLLDYSKKTPFLFFSLLFYLTLRFYLLKLLLQDILCLLNKKEFSKQIGKIMSFPASQIKFLIFLSVMCVFAQSAETINKLVVPHIIRYFSIKTNIP